MYENIFTWCYAYGIHISLLKRVGTHQGPSHLSHELEIAQVPKGSRDFFGDNKSNSGILQEDLRKVMSKGYLVR